MTNAQTVYKEKGTGRYGGNPQHVELQVFGIKHGN
jgi:acetyl/propionyl-CoA carboxylase alpha subunit